MKTAYGMNTNGFGWDGVCTHARLESNELWNEHIFKRDWSKRQNWLVRLRIINGEISHRVMRPCKTYDYGKQAAAIKSLLSGSSANRSRLRVASVFRSVSTYSTFWHLAIVTAEMRTYDCPWMPWNYTANKNNTFCSLVYFILNSSFKTCNDCPSRYTLFLM